MHCDFVKSYSILSENIAKDVSDAQDAFDRARVRRGDSHDGAGGTQSAEDPIQKNTDTIRKVMGKIVEMEQRIAKGAAGGLWRCRRSMPEVTPPKQEHGSRDVRRQGGGLEKLAGGGRGGQPSVPGASKGCWPAHARRDDWDLESCKGGAVRRAGWWRTTSKERDTGPSFSRADSRRYRKNKMMRHRMRRQHQLSVANQT